jgi:hypothetical protein
MTIWTFWELDRLILSCTSTSEYSCHSVSAFEKVCLIGPMARPLFHTEVCELSVMKLER